MRKYCSTILILSILMTALFPVRGDVQHYTITNAYSAGDKVMFIVNENGTRWAFLYEGRVVKYEIFNFSEDYQPIHWNGRFWLLKSGRRNVTLALYNGSLRIIKRFKNGTLCNDNLFVKWNGNEYLIQFIQGPSRCGLGAGGEEHSKLYILRDGRLYHLAEFDGSVPAYWIHDRWFIIGNGTIYTVKNYTLRKIGNVRGMASLVSGGLLTVERVFNSSSLRYKITVYQVNSTHMKKVFSEIVDGIVDTPEYWIGIPVFTLKKDGYYRLMVFNKTSGSFFGIRICKGNYLRIIPYGKSVLAVCGRPLSRKKAGGNEWSVFRIEGNVLREVAVLRNREWPYIYHSDEVRGFPALTVKNETFLIVSGFVFNTSTVINLSTGKTILLPKEIRWKNYRIVQYNNGWMLFTGDRIYLVNNTQFSKIVLEEHGNAGSGSENSVQGGEMYVFLLLFAVVLILILRWR